MFGKLLMVFFLDLSSKGSYLSINRPWLSQVVTEIDETAFGNQASVRLGHKSLRTLMKRSSSWYLPGLGLESHEEDSCI
jgi:hypothetical protein